MITWPTVVDLDASAASVPVGTQTLILQFVYLQLNATRWGARLDMAATFLAAHMAILSAPGRAGSAGPITMDRLADAQTQFGNPWNIMDWNNYDTTAWGKQLRALQRQLGVLGFVTRA